MATYKSILCVDFDGVINSYSSGWQGADVISDPPVKGAVEFLLEAINYFRVMVFSSRSCQLGGIKAMQEYLELYSKGLSSLVEWPTEKPSAFVTIDDRVICFDGTWPTMQFLKEFKPWNKR